ncbi:unnamed protein product, partial [Arabidopsis halleri]
SRALSTAILRRLQIGLQPIRATDRQHLSSATRRLTRSQHPPPLECITRRQLDLLLDLVIEYQLLHQLDHDSRSPLEHAVEYPPPTYSTKHSTARFRGFSDPNSTRH